MSGLKRTSPGYCVRCGKTHKTEKAAVKCLARYMKDRSKEKKSESIRELTAQLDEARKRKPKKAAKKDPLEVVLAKFGDEAEDYEMEIGDAISEALHGLWDVVFKSRGTIRWGAEKEHQDSTLGDPHYWGVVRYPEKMPVTKKVSYDWHTPFLKSFRDPKVKKELSAPDMKVAIEHAIKASAESILGEKPDRYDARVLKLGDRVEDIAWEKGKIETEGTAYDEEGEVEGGVDVDVRFNSWVDEIQVSPVKVSSNTLSFEVTIPFRLEVFRLHFPGDYDYHRH